MPQGKFSRWWEKNARWAKLVLPAAAALPVLVLAGWEAALTVCALLLAYLALPGVLPGAPPTLSLAEALAKERTGTALRIWSRERSFAVWTPPPCWRSGSPAGTPRSTRCGPGPAAPCPPV
ncbi:hypothetical protein [Streptomyces sp. NPDC020141]|uniref:hypothetical protein n=1 Tax=Streptomyces sp. NPDC020141 TaxID=3365065 RepID=UPI003795B8F3